MIRLSAFADEISPDLNEQIAVLKSENIHFLDLRGVWNTNVLDLSDKQTNEIKETLDAHSIEVAAIGSPIGKIPIDSPFDEQLQRFERAIALAQFFQTPFIRIFSFYPPAASVGNESSASPAVWRDEVLRRLREMTARARAVGIILLHENEKDIYGDTIARCVDLLQSCDDAHMQAVFDPANFIQCEQTPYPDAYEALHPWLRYMHVKDARARFLRRGQRVFCGLGNSFFAARATAAPAQNSQASTKQPRQHKTDGSVVAAGEGMARWPDLLQRLREDGYDGFFSLEPHLAAAGRYQGFSGPDLFRRASQALQGMLQTMGWEYA